MYEEGRLRHPIQRELLIFTEESIAEESELRQNLSANQQAIQSNLSPRGTEE